MKELLGVIEPRASIPVPDLIQAGESAVLEFKDLEKTIAKTVAGFMNSEGGTLLIGVSDDGGVLGIDADLQTIGRRDRDGYEQKLRQALCDFLGAEFSGFVRSGYHDMEDNTLCVVSIDPSPKAVYLENQQLQTKEFYIRSGNTTRPLDMRASHDYIQMHWQ